MSLSEGLTQSQVEFLQQSGILEAFHYGLSHLAASGVYLSHTFEPNSVFAAQQIHKQDPIEEEPQRPKKLNQSSSTPALPSIGAARSGATSSFGAAITGDAPKKAGVRDAYEIMAAHIERFSTSWNMDEQSSELLATLPSSSTAHPKRRPHVSQHIHEFIRTQKESTAKPKKKKPTAPVDGSGSNVTSPQGASIGRGKTSAVEEKGPETELSPDSKAKAVWAPEIQLRQKRDTKAYLASAPRVFSKSPTRNQHINMAGLYDGSAARIDEAVPEGKDFFNPAHSLHARSPVKKKKQTSKTIIMGEELSEDDREKEIERRLSPLRAKYFGDASSPPAKGASTITAKNRGDSAAEVEREKEADRRAKAEMEKMNEKIEAAAAVAAAEKLQKEAAEKQQKEEATAAAAAAATATVASTESTPKKKPAAAAKAPAAKGGDNAAGTTPAKKAEEPPVSAAEPPAEVVAAAPAPVSATKKPAATKAASKVPATKPAPAPAPEADASPPPPAAAAPEPAKAEAAKPAAKSAATKPAPTPAAAPPAAAPPAAASGAAAVAPSPAKAAGAKPAVAASPAPTQAAAAPVAATKPAIKAPSTKK